MQTTNSPYDPTQFGSSSLAVPASVIAGYAVCPACSCPERSECEVTWSPRPWGSLYAAETFFICAECHAYYGQLSSHQIARWVGVDMCAHSPEDAQYFDFTSEAGERVHGWKDPLCGRVCQFG